jgi:hypothetical protein
MSTVVCKIGKNRVTKISLYYFLFGKVTAPSILFQMKHIHLFKNGLNLVSRKTTSFQFALTNPAANANMNTRKLSTTK